MVDYEFSQPVGFFLIISALFFLVMVLVWRKDRQLRVSDFMQSTSRYILNIPQVRGRPIRTYLLKLEPEFELDNWAREDALLQKRTVSIRENMVPWKRRSGQVRKSRNNTHFQKPNGNFFDIQEEPDQENDDRLMKQSTLPAMKFRKRSTKQQAYNNQQPWKVFVSPDDISERSDSISKPNKLRLSQEDAEIYFAGDSAVDTSRYMYKNSLEHDYNSTQSDKQTRPAVIKIYLHVAKHNHQILSLWSTHFKHYSRVDRIWIYLAQFSNLISMCGGIIIYAENNTRDAILAGVFSGWLSKVLSTFFKYILRQSSRRFGEKELSPYKLHAFIEKRMNAGRDLKFRIGYIMLLIQYAANTYLVFLIDKQSSSSEQKLWLFAWIAGFLFDFVILELGRIAIQLLMIFRVNPMERNSFWSLVYYIFLSKSIVDLFE